MANAGQVANVRIGGEFAKSGELVDVATVANVGYSLWIINICLNFEFSSAIKSELQGFSKKSELPRMAGIVCDGLPFSDFELISYD